MLLRGILRYLKGYIDRKVIKFLDFCVIFVCKKDDSFCFWFDYRRLDIGRLKLILKIGLKVCILKKGYYLSF